MRLDFIRAQVQVLPSRRPEQELPRRERQPDGPLHRPYAHPPQHLPQLRRRLAASPPAVADHQAGLALPLVEQVVDGVLEAGRIPPVVLRGDEDERVARCDLRRPLPRVGVRVLRRAGDQRRQLRLVVQRQVPIAEVDYRHADCGVDVLDGLHHELCDLSACSGGALAADDYANFVCSGAGHFGM